MSTFVYIVKLVLGTLRVHWGMFGVTFGYIE